MSSGQNSLGPPPSLSPTLQKQNYLRFLEIEPLIGKTDFTLGPLIFFVLLFYL